MSTESPTPSFDASFWIDHLHLQAHPEGGYFAEVYRAAEQIPASGLPTRYQGSRSVATSIYFLLTAERFSAFHLVNSDEGWHYYAGNSPITLYVLSPDGILQTYVLGPNPQADQVFQVVVPANHWFAAEVQTHPDAYGLVGCTVSPGFDFADFTLARQSELMHQYPAQSELIKRLTRVNES